jgi:Flp pilus assembly pilin Flp
MLRLLQELGRRDDGMEMLEWAIVGVFLAVALAGAFTAASGQLRDGIDTLTSTVAGLGS